MDTPSNSCEHISSADPSACLSTTQLLSRNHLKSYAALWVQGKLFLDIFSVNFPSPCKQMCKNGFSLKKVVKSFSPVEHECLVTVLELFSDESYVFFCCLSSRGSWTVHSVPVQGRHAILPPQLAKCIYSHPALILRVWNTSHSFYTA